MTSGSENRVPFKSVIVADTYVNLLSKLGDIKNFGEAFSYLPDSGGFAWDLHNCFYTATCSFAQVMGFKQVL